MCDLNRSQILFGCRLGLVYDGITCLAWLLLFAMGLGWIWNEIEVEVELDAEAQDENRLKLELDPEMGLSFKLKSKYEDWITEQVRFVLFRRGVLTQYYLDMGVTCCTVALWCSSSVA